MNRFNRIISLTLVFALLSISFAAQAQRRRSARRTSTTRQRTSPPRTNQVAHATRSPMTGTYRIDTMRGDDSRAAADRAASSLPDADRQRVANDVLARLESPDQLAIERLGRNVTIAAPRAPRVTFVADGVERIERAADGHEMRTRAELIGDRLEVSSKGIDHGRFSVSFKPLDNGQRLSVTRRIYADGSSQPVVVQSYYDKISEVARWDVYGDAQSPPASSGGTNTSTSSQRFVVPDGTSLIAVLNENLSTKQSRERDRFTLTVRQPSQYDGATIEGLVSRVNRSGRVTGRSEMSLNLERIRLRDGRSFRFAGLIEGVRTRGDENVRVDNEGTVQESKSQTEQTVQRAAIGTAAGAIIGAIAGGGKGAGIGAILGAGGGAGSVYAQGRDDLELMSGTELNIRATAPR